MKQFLAIIFLALSSGLSYSQDSSLRVTLLKSVDGHYKDFTTDNLGNIYLVNAKNSIKKVNANGDSLGVYNDMRRYGKISLVDATNPLKLLIYFKDFATIVVLDRFLNARNTIDLRRQNIFQANVIATSYDNNIWVYDEADSRIKKIDDNGTVLLQSNDLRLVFDSTPAPSGMFDRDGQLYLYDKKQGVLVFDYYGAKKNLLQLKGYQDVQVLDKNNFVARDEKSLVLYKPAQLQLNSFKVFDDFKNFSKVTFNSTNVFGLTAEGQFRIYKINH